MRVRLYWSMARLAHTEGRASVALNNVRKAIALLQATDDTLAPRPRAHPRRRDHAVARRRGRRRRVTSTARSLCSSTPPSALDLVEITIQRARIAALRGEGSTTVKLARRALELNDGPARSTTGARLHVLGDGLALMGEHTEADRVVQRSRRTSSSRTASGETRRTRAARGRSMLRELGREEQALDVLERATDLGTARPAGRGARRALSVELAVTPRGPVLPFALGPARERRDAHVSRRPAHAGARRRRADRARTRVAGARRHRDDRRGLGRRRRTAALAPRARRRPLRFPRLVRDDAMLGRASRALRGLRPVRVPTVAQSLLRAFCGQLIEAKVARRLERTIIRKLCAAGPEGLHVAPTTSELGAVAPMQLRALGLHARRAAALVRICRSIDLERLHAQPTDAIVRRLERERGLGPVVGRRRMPRGARSLRPRPRRRPRPRQAPCARCAAARSKAGRPRSCSSRTASGPASRACTCSPASAAACCRSAKRAPHSDTPRNGGEEDRDPRRRPHRRGAACRPAQLRLANARRDRRDDPQPQAARPSCTSVTASRRRPSNADAVARARNSSSSP